MKVYRTHEKETSDWKMKTVDFPESFNLKVGPGDIVSNYEKECENWIQSKMKYFASKNYYRNVVLDTESKQIFYEELVVDGEDVVESYNVESVLDLVKLMKKFECVYFTEYDDGRWHIE